MPVRLINHSDNTTINCTAILSRTPFYRYVFTTYVNSLINPRSRITDHYRINDKCATRIPCRIPKTLPGHHLQSQSASTELHPLCKF